MTPKTNDQDLKSAEPGKIEKDKIGDPKDEKEWTWSFKDTRWTLIFLFGLAHYYGIPTIFYMHYKALQLQHLGLFFWSYFYLIAGNLGVTAGIHRLMAHKTYEAKKPLKIALIIMYLMAGQLTLRQWIRDHRVHHKYSDTNADPYNIKRGLFFSHFGWLFVVKHPDVAEKGKNIDTSDIDNDPLILMADKYPVLARSLFCFAIPIFLPVLLWNEALKVSFLYTAARWTVALNTTACVNSFAHWSGTKPYDKGIAPGENKYISFFILGEAWHNYHHVFPWDYRASEIGGDRVNFTTRFIDFCAARGWAFNLKTPSEDVIKMTIARRGDGTHEKFQEYAGKYGAVAS